MAKATGKTPAALANQPSIDFILEPYFKAFFDLSGTRQVSMGGELPISPRDILAYAVIHGFDTDIQFFYRVVTECDSVFFDHVSEKRKHENKSAKGKKPGGRRK